MTHPSPQHDDAEGQENSQLSWVDLLKHAKTPFQVLGLIALLADTSLIGLAIATEGDERFRYSLLAVGVFLLIIISVTIISRKATRQMGGEPNGIQTSRDITVGNITAGDNSIIQVGTNIDGSGDASALLAMKALEFCQEKDHVTAAKEEENKLLRDELARLEPQQKASAPSNTPDMVCASNLPDLLYEPLVEKAQDFIVKIENHRDTMDYNISVNIAKDYEVWLEQHESEIPSLLLGMSYKLLADVEYTRVRMSDRGNGQLDFSKVRVFLGKARDAIDR